MFQTMLGLPRRGPSYSVWPSFWLAPRQEHQKGLGFCITLLKHDCPFSGGAGWKDALSLCLSPSALPLALSQNPYEKNEQSSVQYS